MSTFMAYLLDHQDRIWGLTGEHVVMIGVAMVASVIIGVAVGIFITGRRRIAAVVLYIAGIIMTVPSIAMFALMIPLFGLGFKPAVVGLILYTQLPVLRNTYVGLTSIDPSVIEAATGLGMPPRRILLKVRLPLALPVIMAGVRTSVVMGIGIAAIAAYIGSGGLGELIFRGIARSNGHMILAGTVVVALLSVVADYGMGWVEKRYMARGAQGGAG